MRWALIDRSTRPAQADTARLFGRSFASQFGLRIAHVVDRVDLVSRRIANHVEPPPAPVRMEPALVVRPDRVVSHKEICGPNGIVDGLIGPNDMGRAAELKLGLIAHSAIGTCDSQHAECSFESR